MWKIVTIRYICLLCAYRVFLTGRHECPRAYFFGFLHPLTLVFAPRAPLHAENAFAPNRGGGANGKDPLDAKAIVLERFFAPII